ncbi:MAG: spore maturation protein, partial [Clostridia bacterium]|nr:spore maturation protein [Clostridia bacterium]
SLASLENILSTYGPDSYVGKCASVICGANDTILYIVAVYTANVKNKKIAISIPISIFASFLGVIIACFLCRFL